MPQQPRQKGNLKPLWELLGIAFSGGENGDEFQPIPGDEEGMGGADQIVFQNYNPFPKRSDFPPEFVFIDNACGGKGFDPFSEKDAISSGLQHLLFPRRDILRSGIRPNWSIANSSPSFAPARRAEPSTRRRWSRV